MPISVTLEKNKLVCKGRPAFPKKTNTNIPVITGLEDRRHMLHGATQITKTLTDSFNRILDKEQDKGLIRVVNSIRDNLKSKGCRLVAESSSLEDKIKELITIAFGKESNLIAGLAVENQGIEKARQTIKMIKEDINKYCAADLRGLEDIRSTILQLINENLNNEKERRVVMYKEWILCILKESISMAPNEMELVNILNDFEFSCTLDILHEKTSKEQNIRGLSMANRLYNAILAHNEEEIYSILLYE